MTSFPKGAETLRPRSGRVWDEGPLPSGHQHLHRYRPGAAAPGPGALRGAGGNNDLWIAAHALAAGLTLITNNEREFRRVQDLKVENWVASSVETAGDQ